MEFASGLWSWPEWSIRTGDRAARGGHDLHDRAPTKTFPVASCRWTLVQGPHVPVAQGVVHVLELLAGGGDLADVAATPVGDALAQPPRAGGRAERLDGLDRRPPDQP
jgi:hypothetical protein